MTTFKVSDNSVNAYGSRVLTSGYRGNHTDSDKVPGFYNHESFDYETYKSNFPACSWENIRIEGDEMFADFVPSTATETGIQLAQLVAEGTIFSASISVKILDTSNLPEFLIEGQTQPTITEWELLEISPCDIPANGSAVAQFNNKIQVGNIIKLNIDQMDIKKLDELKTTLSAMSTDFKDTAMEILKKVDGKESINSQFSEINALVEKNKQEFSELKTAFAAEKEALEKANADLQAEIDALKTETVDTDIEALQAEKAELEAQLTEAQAASEATKTELETATTELEETKSEFSLLKEKYDAEQVDLSSRFSVSKESKATRKELIQKSKNKR